ncbi:MAG TPA: hypothetical protein VGM52_10075 [Herbaspirillum sp.]|jgi:hypothetical protein
MPTGISNQTLLNCNGKRLFLRNSREGSFAALAFPGAISVVDIYFMLD